MATHRSLTSAVPFLTQLAGQPRLWEPKIEFDPWSRHYVRLAAEPGLEAWLLTWLPGQTTEWHDHGGVAGAFLTVRGALSERRAAARRNGFPRILPGVRTVAAGALRPFGPQHIHRVTNAGSEPAVSLHVYTPALTEMNEYAVDGDRLVRTEALLAGRSW